MKETKNEQNSHFCNHGNQMCQCHSNCTNNKINKNLNTSDKNEYIKEKIIFIPIIILKIMLSFYLYEKYFCYSLGNPSDIKFSQRSIILFIIYLLYLYLLAILSSANQTNIDKYTILNLNKQKKELIQVKQEFTICNFCHSAKFIRNSHCRLCNKCISFRDHHCPFVTNCIGFNNIQYFINFCFWGSYGIILDIISYFNFKYINLSISIMILFKVDLIANFMFLLTLIGIIIRSLLSIYNNRTYIESIKHTEVEIKCPVLDCAKESNKFKINNDYNIGFLNHLYYLVGPSLLHFIFPLPKFKNYTFDENCPIFSKIKSPDRLELIKYKLSENPNYIREAIDDASDPDKFIKQCHTYYDGKKII